MRAVVTESIKPMSYFPPHSGGKYDRKPGGGLRRFGCAALLAVAIVLSLFAAAPSADAAPTTTRFSYASGEIVPIPASIPHEEGDMVDRRIVANLRWIAQRFPIYVNDGYSGRLPGGGEHTGCHGCHVKNSDHHNGLAVDIVALNGRGGCDAAWNGITRLALWAEPAQNRPRAPFRWVGYDGDAGHGCGHHLHLSWEHAEVREFELAQWVEVFPVGFQGVAQKPVPSGRPSTGVKPPEGPPGGSEPGPTPLRGPRGGVSAAQQGGLSPRGD
jgi:hypothetical protein